MSCSFAVSSVPSTLSDYSSYGIYINVFGTLFFAKSEVPNTFVVHAACIMKGWLDNDNDGVCDDIKVCNKLAEVSATLIMTPTEGGSSFPFFKSAYLDEQVWRDGFKKRLKCDEGGGGQPLYQSEIHPNSCAYASNSVCDTRFDASLEEILHLITNAGVSKVYPEFVENYGSTLGKLIKDLNGDCGNGSDYTNPSGGGCTGYYAYDDRTCDENCLVGEGIYWAITSLLGAQEYQAEAIKQEWTLYSKALMESKAPELTSLLRNKESFPWLPTSLPNTTQTRTFRRLSAFRGVDKNTFADNLHLQNNSHRLENHFGFLSYVFLCSLFLCVASINNYRNRKQRA